MIQYFDILMRVIKYKLSYYKLKQCLLHWNLYFMYTNIQKWNHSFYVFSQLKYRIYSSKNVYQTLSGVLLCRCFKLLWTGWSRNSHIWVIWDSVTDYIPFLKLFDDSVLWNLHLIYKTHKERGEGGEITQRFVFLRLNKCYRNLKTCWTVKTMTFLSFWTIVLTFIIQKGLNGAVFSINN